MGETPARFQIHLVRWQEISLASRGMSERYRVVLDNSSGVNVPQIDAEFGRVTVLLGANGSGKSSALLALAQKFGPIREKRQVVRVEGGRTVTMPVSLDLNRQTFERYGTLAKANQSHSEKVMNTLSSRTQDALFLLLRQGDGVLSEHSRAVTRWQANPGASPCPIVNPVPIERLFAAFREIFPEIELSLTEDQKLVCRKGPFSYAGQALSDGERQVLALLADISMLAKPRSLLLVDEPELNLHPRLANRVWDRIEADLPESVFVYSSHSIGFAMRESVEQIIVLGSPGRAAINLPSLEALAPTDAREFLGSIPAIVSSATTLVTEGESEDSFDSIFYSWLLDGSEIRPCCLGSCENVLAASAGQGIWEKIAAGVKVAGIIDRDFRSDQQLLEITNERVEALAFHEAESYLCEPDLLHALALKLGTVEHVPSNADLVEKVVAYANKHLLSVVAKRTMARSKLRLAVSLEKKIFSRITDADDMRRQFEAAAKSECDKVTRTIGEAAVLSSFDQELAACTKAIATQNVLEILRLFPGKQLLNEVAPLVGCRDSTGVARGVRTHFSAVSFVRLRALKEQILQLLPPTGQQMLTT